MAHSPTTYRSRPSTFTPFPIRWPTKQPSSSSRSRQPVAFSSSSPVRRRASTPRLSATGASGFSCAQVLVRAGARVTIFGRHDEKLRLGREWGAETSMTAASNASRGRFDVVVEATGRPAGLDAALSLVRPRGTIVLKSTIHGTAPISTTPIVVDEVTLIGSRCGPFSKALDLLAAGTIDVAPLISARYPLTGWRQAFDAARTCLKVLLDPRLESGV